MACVMESLKERLIMFGGILILFTTFCTAESYTPNIIIITADDIGFADVGFNNPDLNLPVTPNLDKYAEVSMVLKNYYVSPNGFSTRSALLTAKHPAVLGTQFETQDATIPHGLHPSHTLLPEYLKTLNYECHAVGQWDLGFYSKDMLPTERGYDSFYGSYLSYGDYKTHMAKDRAGHEGLDLHNNIEIDKSEDGSFKPELYTQKARDIIEAHDSSKPLHLYVALQGAQIDNYEVLCKTENGRGKIPNDYYRAFMGVEDPVRRCYLALVSAVDRAFGSIAEALVNKMILRNSVLVFTTTSGGPAAGQWNYNAASNFPFRGAKLTGWEGAVRGVALVYTDRKPKDKRFTDCLFHVSDWIPTLLTLYKNTTGSALSTNEFSPMYGVDQYNCVFRQHSSNRYAVINFLYGKSASARINNYKYIVNTDKKMAQTDEWYGPGSPNCSIRNSVSCDPTQGECLFRLSTDPCEMNNIAAFGQDVQLLNFHAILSTFNETVKYSDPAKAQEAGNPANFDNSWQSWVQSVNAASSLTFSYYFLAVGLLSVLR